MAQIVFLLKDQTVKHHKLPDDTSIQQAVGTARAIMGINSMTHQLEIESAHVFVLNERINVADWISGCNCENCRRIDETL